MTEARQATFGMHGDLEPSLHFVREAARHWEAGVALRTMLHEAGQRERYRQQLTAAIAYAERALAAAVADRGALPPHEAALACERTAATMTAVHVTLARAHGARAEDALHGAGQLSLGAQRAPTREACEEGWARVAAIVAGAEASAVVATASAALLEAQSPRSAATRTACAAARRAEFAARAARKIVETRNHAYTFHADSRFSFGEGWYLAAAAVLAGVAIQIEPDKDGTAQAEQFLFDAGLRSQCQPYRSRPRAMKQTTEIVGRAFRAEPLVAQQKVRAAFLGDEPIPNSVRAWVDGRLTTPGARHVLLWIRDGVHHSGRNSNHAEVVELTRRVRRAGLVPVLTGDPLRDGPVPEGAVDMILFWKDSVFRGADTRRAQLQFFEHLRLQHGLVGQLGVTTAGMDGPALMGLATMYLTDSPNPRMREWVGAVPGYREVVRQPGYLDGISHTLSEWAGR